MPASFTELLSKANAAAIRFMQTEVETGLSFVRMAARVRSRKKVRPGDAEKIKRYVGYAHLAYDTVFSRIRTANGTAEELNAINQKIAELQTMLEET